MEKSSVNLKWQRTIRCSWSGSSKIFEWIRIILNANSQYTTHTHTNHLIMIPQKSLALARIFKSLSFLYYTYKLAVHLSSGKFKLQQQLIYNSNFLFIYPNIQCLRFGMDYGLSVLTIFHISLMYVWWLLHERKARLVGKYQPREQDTWLDGLAHWTWIFFVEVQAVDNSKLCSYVKIHERNNWFDYVVVYTKTLILWMT